MNRLDDGRPGTRLVNQDAAVRAVGGLFKLAFIGWCIAVLIGGGLLSTVAYVAWHFISKVW